MRETMKKITQGATRLVVLALAVFGLPNLVHAEYVAGWDFSSLAKQQWETSAGTAIALDGSAPHTWTSMPEDEMHCLKRRGPSPLGKWLTIRKSLS